MPAGRASPAAAVFFGLRNKNTPPDDLEMTRVFSPLVANQESTRPLSPGIRTETWSITINGDEVRELPNCDIANGAGLPWKLATWGSTLDASLLAKMWRTWPPLSHLEAHWSPKNQSITARNASLLFFISEGPQLRPAGGEDYEPVPALVGAEVADVKLLKRSRRIFSFNGVKLPKNGHGFLRVRGGRKGLAICRPPHVSRQCCTHLRSL